MTSVTRFSSDKRLMILDADGTIIDAYRAIDAAFCRRGMALGDLERFQRRRHLFKYLGGLKEFPANLKKQVRKSNRKKLIMTLTDVYREEAVLFPGVAELIRQLIAAPDVVVGLVTRNVTDEPEHTIRLLFRRHGIDADALDFLVHIPLRHEKTPHFRAVRERFGINPARAYMCGDEHKDFLAATGSGLHPFIVSYGFEDHKRLTKKFGVPDELISRTSEELCERVRHALGLS